MKKMKKLLAVLMAMIFAAMPISSHGESLADKVNKKLGGGVQTAQELSDGSLKVTVDRQRLDAVPINENGSVLVPMRAIFEALDALVAWDGETQSIYCRKNNVWAVLKIGDQNVTVIDQNGSRTVTLAAAPKLIDGSTYVPVRAAEILNAKVEWHGDENWVEIYNTEGLNEAIVSDGSGSLIGGIVSNGSLYTLDRYGRFVVCNENGALEYKTVFANGYIWGERFVGPVGDCIFYTYTMGSSSLYKLDLSTGENTKLLGFSGRDGITIYNYANGYLYCGYDGNIYVIDTLSGESKYIYSDEESKVRTAFEVYNDMCFVFNAIDKIVREIIAVDINTGDKKVIYTKKYDTAIYSSMKTRQNRGYIYWKERFRDGTDEYYKLNCDDYTVEEASKEEYDNQVNLRTYDAGSGYNIVTNLYKDCHYLTSDSDNLYFYEIIDHKSYNNDRHLYYTIYMSDLDGSNKKAIYTYNGKASGDSSATGNNTSQKGSCSTCGGTGLVTCHICHGTLGHYIRMLGEQVWQGCATCGQTGTVICPSCGSLK